MEEIICNISLAELISNKEEALHSCPAKIDVYTKLTPVEDVEQCLKLTKQQSIEDDVSKTSTSSPSLPQPTESSLLNVQQLSNDATAQQAHYSSVSHSCDTVIPGSSEEEIDAKIEAAMDLVKSHLTSAVREEVTELKQRIKKLLDTNALLEKEISLLRQYVSPEILASIPILLYSDSSVASNSESNNRERQLSNSDV
ncbi:hypothetical protein GJ496_009517 [Pomphorhynchus laevis]|nr:hypothetical protein GJ496_009517 [Pomphorhynchus laevis]